MLIASKYEEIWAPEVKDFVYISDKAYTKEQILLMEKDMLKALGFNMTLPTQFNFLARFMKAGGIHTNKRAMTLANYLVELSLSDYSSLCFSYSQIAATAVYVTKKVMGLEGAFSLTMQRHSTYSMESLQPCAEFLVKLMQGASASTLTAVYKKYSHTKYMEVSKDQVPQDIL
jgi:hypothetical protein